MSTAQGAPPGSTSRSAAGNRNPWLIAVVVSIATFMLVLDTSIANVALLQIAGSLAASQEEATWVITTYLVANAIIVPVSGWLSTVIGRKRYYMLCVAVFTGASLLCGLAWNLTSLIAFRAMLVLIPWEMRREDPVLDVRLLLGRQFGMSFVTMMAVGAVLFGSTQILPQLLQEAFGYSAYLSGLSMMPGGVAMLFMMPIAGQITNYIQPKYLIAGGLAGISIAMWHMTSLTPDATFGFFQWARVFQMIGLPFLFIPINTVAYAGLAPEKTNNASALINMARNLGGSFGISLANTVVARRSQFHHERLAEAITPTSTAYNDALAQAQHFFQAQGASLAHARELAFDWIGQTVGSQSVLLAYVDVFWVSSIFAIGMVPLVLLLLKRVELGAARPAVH